MPKINPSRSGNLEKKTGKGTLTRGEHAPILRFASSGNATNGYLVCVLPLLATRLTVK